MKNIIPVSIIIAISFVCFGVFSAAPGVSNNSLTYDGGIFAAADAAGRVVEKILPGLETEISYGGQNIKLSGNPMSVFRQLGDVLDTVANFEY